VNHRKSLDEWWQGTEPPVRDAAASEIHGGGVRFGQRDVLALPSLRAAATAEVEAMLAAAAEAGLDVGIGGPPRAEVELNELEYAVWLAVELARSDSLSVRDGKLVNDPSQLAASLEDEFGSPEAVAAAREVYGSILQRLHAAGPGSAVAPPPALDSRALEAVKKLRRLGASRRTMTRKEIALYSIYRAHELGFSPADIWARRQGRRSPRFAAEHEARERIVVELRDRGASQAEIGAVFGGRKQQSVAGLEAAGRARQQKEERHG
jgi:hypothetical protein